MFAIKILQQTIYVLQMECCGQEQPCLWRACIAKICNINMYGGPILNVDPGQTLEIKK